MRRGLLAAALALVACGRLQFASDPHRDAALDDSTASADDAADARPCIAVGHDDDGDGLDDACDLCPQLVDAGDQFDDDGDGIGNACDISPATVDVRTLFDPFTEASARWTFYNGTVMNDAFVMPALTAGAGADLREAPERAIYEINGVIVATGSPSQISMMMGVIGNAERYYCELYDNGSTHSLALTETFDGTNFTVIAQMVIAAPMMPGAFRLVMDHTPPTTTCLAVVDGQLYTVTGTNPAAVTPNQFSFNVFQNSVEVRSFVRVARP